MLHLSGLCSNTAKELSDQFSAATSDEARLEIMGKLAEIDSIFRDNRRADSLLVKQMLLAEIAQNDNLFLKPMSGAAIDNVATWSNTQTVDRATAFLQKGLTYAKERNNTRLEATIYLKLASLFRKRQPFDRSIEQDSLAFLLKDHKQDSLKAALYLELGEAFSGKGDAVSAFKNYNSAYHIAYSQKNVRRQSAASEVTKKRPQYTGISMAIAFLFIVLILIGMFPVSKLTIRMLNFVSFICLFEFIILLINNWLHDLAHGEPLKIWPAKILVIALLLPLHHWLEHVATKFLSSQKLQQFRQKISVRKIFHPSKKRCKRLRQIWREALWYKNHRKLFPNFS